MARTYVIEEIEEIGDEVLPGLANAYLDLSHGARTAGSASDSMFQEASVTSNTGPGSGGTPIQPPGSAEVAASWRALFVRFVGSLNDSASNLEYLTRAMKLTAESMRTAEEATEFELTELQNELDSNY